MCEHCASGCAQRTDHRRGKVLRRLAGDDPQVNEEWNCDKGRWAFTYTNVGDRITTPQIRDDDGKLRPGVVVGGPGCGGGRLAAAAGSAGVLVGGRATGEDAYAYSKFAGWCWTPTISTSAPARTAPRRPTSSPRISPAPPMTVTYADLEKAPAVLLAGWSPKRESPIVFLRLRKAARKHGVQVLSIAPFATAA